MTKADAVVNAKIARTDAASSLPMKKPRIRFDRSGCGLWVCFGAGAVAWGISPKKAYAQWARP